MITWLFSLNYLHLSTIKTALQIIYGLWTTESHWYNDLMCNVKSDPEPKPIENHWFMTLIFYQEIYFKWIMILLDNAPLNLFDLTLQKKIICLWIPDIYATVQRFGAGNIF